jgi:uncharacterized RDD family membrane protein YckC
MEKEIDKSKIAKFSTRLGAYLTDALVIGLFSIAINYWNIIELKSFTLYFIVAIVGILYKPLLEYYFGATIGKYALDLKVKNENLDKIDLLQSFKRSSLFLIAPVLLIPIQYLAFNNPEINQLDSFMEFSTSVQIYYPIQAVITNISVAIIVVDLIFMLTDHKKMLRSLHDRIGKTLVIMDK